MIGPKRGAHGATQRTDDLRIEKRAGIAGAMTSARREYENLYIGAGYCEATLESVFLRLSPSWADLIVGGSVTR